MLYYREYFQIPTPDEGKFSRLYFEVYSGGMIFRQPSPDVENEDLFV
jgi:hypothetical protein